MCKIDINTLNDLFKDNTHTSQNVIVTKNGFRVNLSIEELIEKERKDIDDILKNVVD